jgi:hypothetical protein
MDIRIRRGGKALVAAWVTVLAGAACASGGAVAGERGDRTVMVRVENNNWQDANIYVVGSGPRIRLGTVTSMTSERFPLPRTARTSAGVRLQADLIGSNARKVTSRILVNPGDEVRWVLENQLALSSYSVW